MEEERVLRACWEGMRRARMGKRVMGKGEFERRARGVSPSLGESLGRKEKVEKKKVKRRRKEKSYPVLLGQKVK